jgi:predicted MFS family arabinose efflux permease
MALVFAATVANRWFIKHKGLVVGALTAASATGQLIFLPLLSHFAVTYGWKSVSVTIAIASLVVVPLIFFFLKESPQSLGMTPYGAPMTWEPAPKPEMSAFRLAIDTIKQAKSDRNFQVLFFTFFVCGLSTNGLIGTHFIPAAHDHGMAEPVAAGLLAMVGVFDVIGTLASGYLTDKFDPRKLLFFYYGLRGLSLFLLPSILFSSVHPSTLVFVIFYGLDWVATVPPTLVLSRIVLGPNRGTIVYGWVFVAHQIGASTAAFGAALLRVQFGDYAIAFYISAAMCIVSALMVLQIAKGKSASELRV